MPLAPAATCSFASTGLLWVLMCGRLATPAASHAAWMRAMLRSTRSMSTTSAGVPNSRAILAASGVVMVRICRGPLTAGQAQALAVARTNLRIQLCWGVTLQQRGRTSGRIGDDGLRHGETGFVRQQEFGVADPTRVVADQKLLSQAICASMR